MGSVQGQAPLEVPQLPHKRTTPGKSLMKARETLQRSAEILLRGANDLKNCLGAKNGSEHAFHDCLWSLREKWRLVRSQVSLFVCSFTCLLVCLFVCLLVCLLVYLFTCLLL